MSADPVTDIGGLDDMTGPGLEQVTVYASETSTGMFDGGATFAAAADAPGNGGRTHGADDHHGPLMPGQNFGDRYHIVRLLGLGGMGAVYQAWDTELGVVGRGEGDQAGSRRRPDRGAGARAALQAGAAPRAAGHAPNVVRIHDLGEMHGIKYITMPYVQGEDLSTLLKREGKLPVHAHAEDRALDDRPAWPRHTRPASCTAI